MPIRRSATTLDLDQAEIDFLLFGETATGQEADRFESETGRPYGDVFLEYFANRAPERERLIELGNKHRAALLAEWARRGGSGDPWFMKVSSAVRE